MKINLVLKGCLVAAALSLSVAPALADMQSARGAQGSLNGDSVANGAILGGAWQSSFASNLVSDLGVMQHSRPDYDPKGMPMGGFRLFPVLSVAGGYSDNIYYTPSPTQDDVFWDVDPSLSLRSQWGRHSLAIYGGTQSTFFDKFSTENTTDWNIGTAGRLDIMGDSDLRANVYYDQMHEPRSSPNAPGNVKKPTQFALFHGDAAWDYRPNRFGLTLGASYDDYHYKNSALIGGGTLNNSGRNEDVTTVYGRATYDFSPGYSMFVGGSYEDRNFLKAVDNFGFDRDSTGYRADIGTQFFISRLVQGQVYVGYLSQSFKAPLPNIHVVDYGANINWYATPLLTLHVGAGRNIDDTTIAAVSATDDQSVYASADYELLRNVIVQGQVGYSSMKYVGTARQDKLPNAGAQVTWLVNHNLSFTAQYSYSHRNANVPAADFTGNTFMLGAKLQL